MVSKCKVVINNDAVTVFEFNGSRVQVPAIHKDKDFINVKYEDGKFIIVDENYKEDLQKNVKSKKKKQLMKQIENE